MNMSFKPIGMPVMIQRVVLMLIALSVTAACQPDQPENTSTDAANQPRLLLISIDGFRHDYFDLGQTPALDRLVDGGVAVDSLHHVFPTKTFPTHYSVVTGKYPGNHGLVANSMWDPDRDARFSLGNREAVGDGFWYQAGEPIWVTAEKQGMTTATYFWPGSEARIGGVRPTYWKMYDGDVPHEERIDQVLEWVDMPTGERPELITLYFSTVDSAGHRWGPREAPVQEALEEIDGHLNRLLDELAGRGVLDDFYVLLTSDHGMSRVDFDRYIMLDDYLDLSKVRVSDWGPATQIWATDMPVDDIVDALEDAHPNLRVWAKEDIPERYQFRNHRRVPDVLAEADLGWMISNKPYMAGRSQFQLYGMHGWDPALSEMHGGFAMMGPGFAPGSKSPALRSVDLYELMAHVLDITPAENDGTLAPFEPYLNANDAVSYTTRTFDCDDERVEARIAPAHMALHWRDEVHVLDRVAGASDDDDEDDDKPHQFKATGLAFAFGEDGASVEIDDRFDADCEVAQ